MTYFLAVIAFMIMTGILLARYDRHKTRRERKTRRQQRSRRRIRRDDD